MTRYLLDTNIISNVTKPRPSGPPVTWTAEQTDEDLFLSALTIAEIWRGVVSKPAGRKREELERWFFGPEGPRSLFAGRVPSFDEPAALIWARLMAEGTAAGRPRSALDMIIAATAEANGGIAVTDDESDFAGIGILNPMHGR